jgi:hypothetical protein
MRRHPRYAPRPRRRTREIAKRETITTEKITIEWPGGTATIKAGRYGWQVTVTSNSRGRSAALRIEAILREIPTANSRGSDDYFYWWFQGPMPPDIPERLDAAAMKGRRKRVPR